MRFGKKYFFYTNIYDLYFIFVFYIMSWSQVGNVNALLGDVAGDKFGHKCAINGDGTIVSIGAQNANSTAGEVQVWKYENDTWSQLGSDIQGASSGDTASIHALNNDGSRLVIGSSRASSQDGHVRIFNYSSNSWGTATTITPAAPSGSQFGFHVDINGSGDRIVIAARYANVDGGTQRGYVEVYDYDGSSWSRLGDRIEGLTDYDECNSVTINNDGTRIAYGAINGDENGTDSGEVKVYSYNSGSNTWSLLGTAISGDSAGDKLGSSVSLNNSGNILICSTRVGNGSVNYASVYEYSGGSWSKLGSNINFATNNVSTSCDINGNGDIVVIGDKKHNTNTGQVSVYKYSNSSWSLVDSVITGENTDDLFGNQVAINANGDYIATGSPNFDSGGLSNRGKAYVYYNSSLTPSASGNGKTIVKLNGKITIAGAGKLVVR